MRTRTIATLVLAAAALALVARAVLAVPAGGHVAGSGLATRALVPSDIRAEQAAEARFGAARRTATPIATAIRRRARAEAALGRVWRGHGRPSVRSRSATLLALLALDDARLDRANGQEFVLEALGALQSAARLDPANGAAAHDLELLLSNTRQPSAKKRGSGSSAPGTTAPIAGSTPPGSGY